MKDIDSDEGKKKYRVVGPPGTGKTTWLGRQVRRAVPVYGPEDVLVASLTRAAAAEVAGRQLPIPKERVGTLHAHAYRVLGMPKLADTEEGLNEWNKWIMDEGRPYWRINPSSIDMSEAPWDQVPVGTSGEKVHSEIQMARARMVPQEEWNEEMKLFWTAWDKWKGEAGRFDFTDLIEICIDDVDAAPGNPSAIFLDEAQDMDRLMMTLARKWGDNCQVFIMVGDPDQNLYQWRGTDPEAFYDESSGHYERIILEQSYRVPVEVHKTAQQWIRQITDREDVVYHPRPFPGKTGKVPSTIHYPERAVTEAVERSKEGKTVMFLTSCGYMLDPLKAVLRQNGIPFHNPYRRKRGDWNPLHTSGTSMADRMLSFRKWDKDVWDGAASMWSWDDLKKWTSVMSSKKILKHGAKTFIRKMAKDEEYAEADISVLLEKVFDEKIMKMALEGDLDWWEKNLLSAKRKSASYPMRVSQKLGLKSLRDDPRIIIGTIHSVKGGEADIVYLFPDISTAGMRQWSRQGIGRNAIIRQFYVGMTRAREELYLCSPHTQKSVACSSPIW